ncbi:MAG: hypothetical protein WBG69_08075 [Arcobacteraceae bacterium]
MNINTLSLSEKLDLAIETTEQALLEMLLLSPESLVRRAILRNKNVTTDIANRLSYDVTANVSYVASKHHKCTTQRSFKTPVSKCVRCKLDERHLSCEKCPYN